MKLCLQLAGLLQLTLALAHFAIVRRFGWREEMLRLSLFTRQVFWVHMGFLMLTLAGFGAVSLLHATELLERGPLARALLGGLAVFWGARWYCQIFVYRAELWRGHAFNTCMHVLFVLLWTFLTVVYATAFGRQF